MAWIQRNQRESFREFWEEAMPWVHCYCINSRYRLIQYKLIHRLYFSKTKLCLSINVSWMRQVLLCWRITSTFFCAMTWPSFDALHRFLSCCAAMQIALHTGMVVSKKPNLLTGSLPLHPALMLSTMHIKRLHLHKPSTPNTFERIWGPFLAQCHITVHP